MESSVERKAVEEMAVFCSREQVLFFNFGFFKLFSTSINQVALSPFRWLAGYFSPLRFSEPLRNSPEKRPPLLF